MRIVFLLLFVLFYFGCSENKVAGTATDTENTVAGVILTSDNSVASGALVQMLARHVALGENPVLAETKADSLGNFVFEEFVSDSFDLEITLFDSKGNIREIALFKDLSKEDIPAKEFALGKPAVLLGKFAYEEHISDITIGSAFRLSIEGSAIQAHVFAGDSFQISVAPGDLRLAFFPSDEQVVSRLRQKGINDSLIYQEFAISAESGDSLNLGELKWFLDEPFKNPWKRESRLSGFVVDSLGKPVFGAVVRAIGDVYGLSFAKTGEIAPHDFTYTDANGFWSLPFPAKVLADSFRVETEFNGGLIGVSPFVQVADLKRKEGDTIWVDTMKLEEPSEINLNIRLVVNQEDSLQVDNCYMNSVIVGLVGTSKFKQIITCAPMDLPGLPSGEHSFVFYTSDIGVLNVLHDSDVPMDDYMRFINVTLTPGEVLYQQGITYTPPTL